MPSEIPPADALHPPLDSEEGAAGLAGAEATTLDEPGILALPWAFARVGWFLCLAAALVVIFALLPPEPGTPGWWRRAALVVPAQAPMAIVGLCLAHLGVLLDPDNPLPRRRLRWLRRAAAAAAGLLLVLMPVQLGQALIPADAVLSGGGPDPVDQRVRQRFAALRSAVGSAASVPELRERLRVLQGPPLDPRADSLPLPLVRGRLLLALERSQPFVVERVKEGRSQRARGLGFIEGLRLALPTVLQALALASLSPLAPWTVPGRWRLRGRVAGVARQGQRALLSDLAFYGADEPLASETNPIRQVSPPPSND